MNRTLGVHSSHADAKETAIVLFEHFGRFGAPSQIMSDRGLHLVNQVISEFLAYVVTKHCLSIAYSKELNAIVERAYNRHITAMCFDRQIVDDYEITIPIVHRIQNSHRNTLTNISRNFCLHRRTKNSTITSQRFNIQDVSDAIPSH